MDSTSSGQNPKAFGHAELKDGYYWFNYHLIRDKELRSEADRLLKTLRNKYPGAPGYDPEWLSLIGADPADIAAIEELASKYGTNPVQLIRIATKFYDALSSGGYGAPIHPPSFMAATKGGRVVFELDPRMSQEQLSQLESLLKSLGEELGHEPRKRLKAPKDTELLYCIQKARRKGVTFPAIFKLYQQGRLPGYSGSPDRFDTLKEMTDFYSRHTRAS